MKYKLPRPTKLLSVTQYKVLLKKAVRAESRLKVRQLLLESAKLSYMSRWDQNRAPQMSMTDLSRIRMITRCRLSCHFSFSADFGSGVRCQCRELDTLGHVRRGCRLQTCYLCPLIPSTQ